LIELPLLPLEPSKRFRTGVLSIFHIIFFQKNSTKLPLAEEEFGYSASGREPKQVD